MKKLDQIIIYDGYCNLCSSTVRFIKKKDKKRKFTFIAFQSEDAHSLLNGKVFSKPENDTVIFMRKEQLYDRSEAIIQILREIGGIWKSFVIFKIIPRFIRDKIYNIIAHYRYRWFGRKSSCTVINNE